MTVDELIQHLQALGIPGTAKVLAWDADAAGWYPVSGSVYDPVAQTVELQTDEL